ncbi:hypothetical protein HG530_007490 [Fusarium avenaceum]|nr:hypothetical protein HG530_007490 [Fusarium avenaceum]
MPVVGCVCFGVQPGLVKCLDHLVRQRALLQELKVLLELWYLGHSQNNSIISIFDLKRRVVHHPTQCCLKHGKPMLVYGLLDYIQRLECALSEVALAVHVSDPRLVRETATFGLDIHRLDLSGQKTAGDGVVHDNIEAVSSTGDKEL